MQPATTTDNLPTPDYSAGDPVSDPVSDSTGSPDTVATPTDAQLPPVRHLPPARHLIVIPEATYAAVRQFLLRDPHAEQFGYLLAGVNHSDETVKLLVSDFIPAAAPEDLSLQGPGIVCPSPRFQMRAYSLCKTQGYHLIDVHSHPFDQSDQVRFSAIDDRHEFGSGREGVFGFTAAWIPGIYHASVVFGQHSVDARIYRADQARAVPIDEIQIVGGPRIVPTSARRGRATATPPVTEAFPDAPVPPLSPTPAEKKSLPVGDASGRASSPQPEMASTPTSAADLDRYSRQILAFGAVGQAALQQLCVAIVGVGGLGSVMVEILARLGVGKIIAVDDDHVETSNLARILGSRQADAQARRKKVTTLQDHVAQINPTVHFDALCGTVLDPVVQDRLRVADVLICGTDTLASRVVLNQLAVQYLIPLINLGFGMETDAAQRKLLTAGGKIMTILPGSWCYACLGELDPRALQVELMSPFERARQAARGYITGVDLPNPSVLFLNMTVASLGVCELLNLVAPFKPRDGYLYYDMLGAKLWKMQARRNPQCPVCSPDAGILGRGDAIALEDIRSQWDEQSLPTNLG